MLMMSSAMPTYAPPVTMVIFWCATKHVAYSAITAGGRAAALPLTTCSGFSGFAAGVLAMGVKILLMLVVTAAMAIIASYLSDY